MSARASFLWDLAFHLPCAMFIVRVLVVDEEGYWEERGVCQKVLNGLK